MSPCLQLVMAMALAAVQHSGQVPTKPGQRTVALAKSAPPATSIFSLTVSPSSINFSATDPDLGVVTGSSTSAVQFYLIGSTAGATWTLGIATGGSTFTGCTTIPASAVKATCSGASVSNFSGTAGTAVCSAARTLSTTTGTVLSGKEGSGIDGYNATITFTLTDSWKYIAKTSPTCPITLTYTLNAP